jgi:hypothetical protein
MQAFQQAGMDMAQEQETQHALLIPWGNFAREIGLLSGIESVKLMDKASKSHTIRGWQSENLN